MKKKYLKFKLLYFFLVAIPVTLSACTKVAPIQTGELLPAFCQEWNPDFEFNGKRCALNLSGVQRTKKKPVKGCNPTRRKFSYCSEMTPDEVAYSLGLTTKNPNVDALTLISSVQTHPEQSFLSVNDGFLVNGRRIIPTPFNHIALRFPTRCTNFGSDAMAGMIEWLGHEVGKKYPGKKYSGIKIVVGDVAAPRGGCLWGHSKRVSHRSHKNGLDADIGYLTVKRGRPSPIEFHKNFDGKTNLWFIKKVFSNPYACIKFIFLDRRNIKKLAIAGRNDPDWQSIKSHIQHAAGHDNHFHVRVGNGYGIPGCANPVLSPNFTLANSSSQFTDRQLSNQTE